MDKFDREEADRKLEGKIALVAGTNSGMCVRGKIAYYESRNVAILRPYILFDKDEKPRIVNEDCRVEDPIGVSVVDCETLEEYIRIYVAIPKEKKEEK